MFEPIHAAGRFFFQGDTRFLVKGVVYRLHGHDDCDPLADDRFDDLDRDVSLFKQLGLNTLFVDSIDNTRCHDRVMRLLEDAGIYVLVSLPTAEITTNGAGTTTTFRPYTPQLLQECFAVVECMSQYANTLGLVVANGALSTIYSTAAAPMIKMVIRDVKRYMNVAQESGAGGQRRLPLGYSASNSRLILRTTFNYFTAGERSETVDFFCYANFNWCGESTMQMSGYEAELNSFSDTHIPVFLSQYGCNLGACGARIFQETTAIYSQAMTSVFSGGIAYEFYDSPDVRSAHWGYGLVREEREAVVGGRGLTKLPDFYGLKARLDEVVVACVEKSGNFMKQPVPEGRSGEQEQSGTSEAEVGVEVVVEPGEEGAACAAAAAAVEQVTVKEMPPLSRHWRAGHVLPYTLADWSGIKRGMDEKAWVEVQVEEIDKIDLNLQQAVVSA